MDKETMLKKMVDKEQKKLNYITLIEVLRKFDYNKYLITDFVSNNKVNAFFDNDKFINDISIILEYELEKEHKNFFTNN